MTNGNGSLRSRYFRDDQNFKTNKCSLCGDSEADGYIFTEGYTVCENCAEQMDLQDVLDLFGFDSVSELLSALHPDEV